MTAVEAGVTATGVCSLRTVYNGRNVFVMRSVPAPAMISCEVKDKAGSNCDVRLLLLPPKREHDHKR